MASQPTWLDTILSKGISYVGTVLPSRPTANFLGTGVSIADNPITQTTDITITGADSSAADPRSYGALFNGSHNDTAGIYAAIATGRRVICPPGVAMVEALDLGAVPALGRADGLVLQGAGPGTTGTVFKAIGSQEHVIKVAALDVSISDIRIDGNNATTKAALRFEYILSNVGIKNVIVTNTYRNAGAPLSSADLIGSNYDNNNLEVESMVLDNVRAIQDVNDYSHYCNNAVKIAGSNDFIIELRNCQLAGAYSLINVYGAGVFAYMVQFLQYANAAIRMDFNSQIVTFEKCYSEYAGTQVIHWVNENTTDGLNPITFRDCQFNSTAPLFFKLAQPVVLENNFFGGNVDVHKGTGSPPGNCWVTETANSFNPGKGFTGTGALDRVNKRGGTLNGTRVPLTDQAAALGTNPASTGVLRLPSSTTAVMGRNFANDADIGLIQVGTDDTVYLGDSGVAISASLVQTSLPLAIDSNTDPASAGDVRLGNAGWIASRNAANSGDANLLRLDSSNDINVGDSSALGNCKAFFKSTASFIASSGATAKLTVSNTLLTSANDVAIGSTVASAGTVRLAKTSTIKFRNNANSGDIVAMTTDSSDGLYLGDTATGNVFVTCGASASFNVNVGSTYRLNMTSSLATFQIAAMAIAPNGASAAAGALRLETATAITSRNHAGSADINLVGTDASNNITFGDTTANGVNYKSGAAATHFFYSNATLLAYISPGGSSRFYTPLEFNNLSTTPAQSGTIRLENASPIVWRNAGNSADSGSVTFDASNKLVLTGVGVKLVSGADYVDFASQSILGGVLAQNGSCPIRVGGVLVNFLTNN